MNFHQAMRGCHHRLKKWNKKIYIASLKKTEEDQYGNEILIYDKPEEYMMNVQPLNSEADMREFGINVEQYQKAIIEKKIYFGKFKEGDVAYLDGASPEGEKKDGYNANYVLYPPRNQNKCIRLTFERIHTK